MYASVVIQINYWKFQEHGNEIQPNISPSYIPGDLKGNVPSNDYHIRLVIYMTFFFVEYVYWLIIN